MTQNNEVAPSQTSPKFSCRLCYKWQVGSMRSCHKTILILFNVGCKTSSRNNVLDLLHSTVTRVIIWNKQNGFE